VLLVVEKVRDDHLARLIDGGVEAGRSEVTYPQLAHVAKRHRRAALSSSAARPRACRRVGALCGVQASN
jgi:hypothetical protein